MDNHICKRCGTENESEYTYCKNCGAALEIKQQAPEFIGTPPGSSDSAPNNTAPGQGGYRQTLPQQQNPCQQQNPYQQQNAYQQAPYQQNQYQQPPYQPPLYQQNYYQQGAGGYSPMGGFYDHAPDMDGVSPQEMFTFIGGNAQKFMPKFIKMEMNKSKVSWCWPVAILGFFYGPLGAAIWFMYRKMYKAAIILMCIGTLLTISSKILTYNQNESAYDSLYDSILNGESTGFWDTITEFANESGNSSTWASLLNSIITRVSDYGSCILLGLFSGYLYKQHATRKIKSYRTTMTDQRYYMTGLSSVGGTSGGMLALGIFILVAVTSAYDFFYTFFKLLEL